MTSLNSLSKASIRFIDLLSLLLRLFRLSRIHDSITSGLSAVSHIAASGIKSSGKGNSLEGERIREGGVHRRRGVNAGRLSLLKGPDIERVPTLMKGTSTCT